MIAKQRPGTEFLALAVLVWVSIAVGPWWLGVAVFLGAWAFNVLMGYWEELRIKKLVKRCFEDIEEQKEEE